MDVFATAIVSYDLNVSRHQEASNQFHHVKVNDWSDDGQRHDLGEFSTTNKVKSQVNREVLKLMI